MPAGSDAGFVVTAFRPGQGGACLRCLYIHRGSFKQTPLPQLAQQISEHSALRDKYFSCLNSFVLAL